MSSLFLSTGLMSATNVNQTNQQALEKPSVSELQSLLDRINKEIEQSQNSGTGSFNESKDSSLRKEKTSVLRELIERLKDSDPKSALDYAEQLYLLTEKDSENNDFSRLLEELIILNTRQDKYEQANKYCDQLIEWAEAFNRPKSKAIGLMRKSVILRSQSDLEGAQNLLNLAISVSDDKDLKADIHYQQSIIAFYLGNLDQGIVEIKKSLQHYEARKIHKKQGQALNILAILYGSQGRLKESLEIMMKGLQIAQENNDLNAQASLYSNIALTLDKLEKYQESISIYQDALKLSLELGDKSSEALTLINLGIVYRNLERYEEALDSLNKGLTISKSVNARNISARALSSLSSVSRITGRNEASFNYAMQALKIVEETNDNDVGMSPRRNLAYYYLKKKDYPEALNQVESFKDWAHKKNDTREVADAHLIKSDIYKAMGNFELALEHFQEYKSLFDKAFSSKSEKDINALRVQFEAREKDLTIERLAQEKLLQDEKIALQKTLLANKQLQRNLIIAAMLIVFTSIFFIYKRRAHKNNEKRLTREVAARTEDLRIKNQELEKAYQLVEEKSLTDELTGLKNRRFLIKTLEKELHQIHEQRKNSKQEVIDEVNLIFFLIDLDHFKQVNDNYGHAAGDLVLIQVSDLLRKLFRQTDHVIRWGGEEFLIVVREAKREEAPIYAERLRQVISDHAFNIGEHSELQKTCSIGFSFYPCFEDDMDAVSWTQVVDIADQCLYAAKNSSRNAWIGLDFYKSDPKIRLFPDILKSPQTLIEQSRPEILSSLKVEHALTWQKLA